LRRDPPRGRRLLGRQPAGGPAARRPARHGRAHARRGQAEGPPRPGGRVREPGGGRQGEARRAVAAGGRDGAALEVRGAHRGEAARVLAVDAALEAAKDDWFVREVRHHVKRVLKRLDLTARTFLAVIDEGSCFAGTLLELALAADRAYMLASEDGPTVTPSA